MLSAAFCAQLLSAVWYFGRRFLVRIGLIKDAKRPRPLAVNGERSASGAASPLADTPTPTALSTPLTPGSTTASSPMTSPRIRQRVKSKWMEDADAPNCCKCAEPFTLFNRRHHCRFCKKIFCGKCSSYRIKSQRACIDCDALWQVGVSHVQFARLTRDCVPCRASRCLEAQRAARRLKPSAALALDSSVRAVPTSLDSA